MKDMTSFAEYLLLIHHKRLGVVDGNDNGDFGHGFWRG